MTAAVATICGDSVAAAMADACDLARIPAGRFVMGDRSGNGYPQERPAHEVVLRAFWAGRRAVTAGQYFEFIEQAGPAFRESWCDCINPCFIVKHGDRYRLRDGAADYPMIQVSFAGALAYCNFLSNRWGRPPVYDLATLDGDVSRPGVRLLTEAEWEYACAGPRGRAYGHGDEFRGELVCWRDRAGCHADPLIGGFGAHDRAPVPAGSLPPNGFGLHEMLGNVNEWCHDRYAPYADAAVSNPTGPPTGSFRVIRGGCFLDGPDRLRASYRHGIHYESKCTVDGFRIAINA